MNSPLKEKYPIVLYQDVHWGDMDAFGHVNNRVYFRYFEDARMQFFEMTRMSEYLEAHQVGPILAATNCNFRLPLQYPDRIHIAGIGTIISPKKIRMEYTIYSENYSAIAAEGEGLVVYYDYAAAKSCEIPDVVAQAINSLSPNN